MADISTLITQEALRILDTVTVPTRIYFPSGTFAADVTVTPDAAWENTASAALRKAVTDGRKRGSAAASVTITGTAANPEQMLHAQYVSKPLQAQTISGNIRGQFRALESATGANATIQIGIRVVSQDGTTVRGTLLAVGGTTTTSSTPPEFANALTNRRLLTSGDVTPLPLSTVVCLEGDRLVIEIGHNNKSVSTSQTHGISFGDNTVDLLENDTTTTAQDPWIEFDSTIPFQDQVENLHVVDSGTTQLMNQGWVKMADGPVIASLTAGADLNKNLADLEVLHVQDTVTASVGRSVVIADEVLHVQDTVTASLFLQAFPSDEGLRLADTLTVVLNPLEAIKTEALSIVDSTPTILPIWMVSVSESLKIVDAGGGLTSLIGVIHIQDTVSAALSAGNDISTHVADDTLHVVDSVTAIEDQTATPSESLKIVDTLTVSRDLTASLAAAIGIADSVTEQLDPLLASASDSLKIGEVLSATVQSPLNGTPASEEPTHLQDSTPIGRLDPLESTAASSESLRIADSASGQLTPLRATASDDSLKISDSATGQITMTASASDALKVADSLTVSIDWAASVADSLKISDSVSSAIITLQVAVTSEGLKISDRVVILEAVLNEALKIVDAGQGRTALLGVLHIQDSVQAQVGGQLTIAVTETLRLQDSLSQPERTPYDVTLTETVKLAYTQSEVEYTQDEYLKLSESVAADLAAPGTLSTSISAESLTLSDAAAMNRDLECPVTQEVGKLADSLTMSRDIEATLSDSLTLADSVTAIEDQTATPTDSGKLADTVLTLLDPEQGVTTDTGILADAVAVSLGNPDDMAVGMGAEILTLVESLTVVSDLTAAPTETLRILEVVDAGSGTTLLATASETVHIGEFLDTGTDLRIGLEQEDLLIGDTVTASLAIPLVIEAEALTLADSDLQLGLDLATDTNPLPEGAIREADPGDTWRPRRRAKITWRSAKAKITWRSPKKRLQ